MTTEVLMPELGLAGGSRATLSVWFAEPGEEVCQGDRLVELLLEGTTYDLPAPATGRLVEIAAFPNDELQPGQLLALLESDEPADAGSEPA